MYPFIEFAGNKIGVFPFCTGIGLGFGTILIFWQLKKFSVSDETENSIMIAIPLTFITGVAGAYIADAFLRGGGKAMLDAPLGWGLTFYGWLLAACCFIAIYARARNISVAFVLNLFCPSFAIAQALGRVGCFLGGCCYGCPSEWGVVYPAGSLPYAHYGATPLMPVQLCESAYLLIIFVVLFFFISFKYRAAWYTTLVPTGRFVLEFFRADDRGRLVDEMFSPSQWISIVLFIVGILWIAKMKHEETTSLIHILKAAEKHTKFANRYADGRSVGVQNKNEEVAVKKGFFVDNN